MEKPAATQRGTSGIADHFNYRTLESGVSNAGLRSKSIDGKATGFTEAVADYQRDSCGLIVTTFQTETTGGVTP